MHCEMTAPISGATGTRRSNLLLASVLALAPLAATSLAGQHAPIVTLRMPDVVYAVAFSPDGRTLASASGDTVRLYDVAKRKQAVAAKGNVEIVSCLALDPGGRGLVTGGLDSEDARDGLIQLWTLDGKSVLALGAGTGPTRSVAYFPDGKRIVAAKGDATLRIWDVATQTNAATLRGHSAYVLSVAVSPDGRTIASGSGDATVRLWDAAGGICIATLKGHTDGIFGVAWAPNGATVASASGDSTIRLWNVGDGKSRVTLTGHSRAVYGVAFSLDGKTLASGSRDGTVRVWDARTGKNTRVLNAHRDSVNSVAFSPDGRTLASGGRDHTIMLWDLDAQGSRRKTGGE